MPEEARGVRSGAGFKLPGVGTGTELDPLEEQSSC